jgi:hypothetical protein
MFLSRTTVPCSNNPQTLAGEKGAAVMPKRLRLGRLSLVEQIPVDFNWNPHLFFDACLTDDSTIKPLNQFGDIAIAKVRCFIQWHIGNPLLALTDCFFFNNFPPVSTFHAKPCFNT